MESWWVSDKESAPKLVKDCSPKRMVLQIQQLQNNLQGVQASLCESRNEYNRLAGYLQNIVEASQMLINQKENKYEKIDSSPSVVRLIE